MVVTHLHFRRRAEAEICRARAYQMQRVFIDPIKNPAATVINPVCRADQGKYSFRSFIVCRSQSTALNEYIIDYAEDIIEGQSVTSLRSGI